MELLPHVEAGRGGEIQLTDALKELLKHEEVYAVAMDSIGYDTGCIISWLEANVSLALESDEFGPALREKLERMLGEAAV